MIHEGLWDRIRSLEELCSVQREQIDLLIARGDLAHAHTENLIERVAELEKYVMDLMIATGVGCNCGYGGQHDPANPRCARNQEIVRWTAEGRNDDPSTHQAQG